MRLLPCADVGLLVELDDLAEVMRLHAALRATPPPGVLDLVPAARTLLLRLDPDVATLAEVEHAVRTVPPVPVVDEDVEPVELAVAYDGDDLAEVASLLGWTTRELITAHAGTEWTVAFGGFAPGFGYLTGPEWTVEVPRRAESRTAVPPGSVALAGTFSGVYPRSSPGGWQLIGRTETVLWDTERDPPALLRPGVRVRFVEAG